MSLPRTALGCASNSTQIVAAGGVTCAARGSDFSVLNSVEVYDPRYRLCCDSSYLSVKEHLLCFEQLRLCDQLVLILVLYLSRRNMWSHGIPMIEPRAWCSLTYLNNGLYAIGGKKTIHTNHHAGIEVFDIQNTSSWTIVTELNKRAFHTSSPATSK